MKTTKTDTEQAKRVAKMLQEKILDPHDDPPGDEKFIRVYRSTKPLGGGYAPDGVLLDNGKVLFCRFGHRQGIDGVVGGFNMYAVPAAQALADLGLISQNACDAFERWFLAIRDRRIRKSDRQRVEEEAAELGYDLVKKKKTRA